MTHTIVANEYTQQHHNNNGDNPSHQDASSAGGSSPPPDPRHVTYAATVLGFGHSPDSVARKVAANYGLSTDAAERVVGAADAKREDAAGELFETNDVGNARRLVYRHGDTIRFVPEWRQWLSWDGTRWEPDATGEVMRRAKATAKGIYAEAALEPDADDTRRVSLGKWANASQSHSRLRDMVATATSEDGIWVRAGDLDADPWALNVANGTLDLRTGVLGPHDPAGLHTKITAAGYDPTAVAPRWERFMSEVIPDPEVRRFVQKYAGYSISGSVGGQSLAFLYGSGANGKSVFLAAIRDVLAEYATEAAPELLVAKRERGAGDLSAVAELQGLRFVSTAEVDNGQQLAEGLVKQLTGETTLKARRMRQDFFEFQNTSKLWLAANHKPVVRGTDHAIWRRIRLVPFTETIAPADQDPDLLAKLAGERDGILRWLVEGCLAWQAEGLKPPDAVEAATDAYREEMDPLSDWLQTRCEFAAGARTAGKALRHDYDAFCAEEGRRPLGAPRFAEGLRDHGCEPYRVKSERGWVGIRLTAAAGGLDV